MNLADLWTGNVTLKRRNCNPYPECNLLIVLAALSPRTRDHLPDLLELITDVSDPHRWCLSNSDLVFSRTHKNGSKVDLECWTGVGEWSRERLQSTLVKRPSTLLLLLTDMNADDPETTKRTAQALMPLTNVKTSRLCVMSKRAFPSRKVPQIFHVGPVTRWARELFGDEVDLISYLRRTCSDGRLLCTSLPTFRRAALNSSRPQSVESRRSTKSATSSNNSTHDTSKLPRSDAAHHAAGNYVPGPHCARKLQAHMNQIAFNKFRQWPSSTEAAVNFFGKADD